MAWISRCTVVASVRGSADDVRIARLIAEYGFCASGQYKVTRDVASSVRYRTWLTTPTMDIHGFGDPPSPRFRRLPTASSFGQYVFAMVSSMMSTGAAPAM